MDIYIWKHFGYLTYAAVALFRKHETSRWQIKRKFSLNVDPLRQYRRRCTNIEPKVG